MYNRRNFLKAASLALAGLLNPMLPNKVHSLGLIHAITTSSISNWSDWDGLDQEDINVAWSCRHDALNAGDDDIGFSNRNILSGLNLIATQAFNVPGATGSPSTRALNGTSQYFSILQPLVDDIIANANNTWSIIIRMTSFTRVASDYFFRFDGTTNELFLRVSATNKLESNFVDGVGNALVSSTDDLPASGPLTVYFINDGVNNALAAFDTTGENLTSFSGIPNQVADSSRDIRFNGNTFATNRHFYSDSGTGNWLACSSQFIIMDNTALVNIA